MIYLYHTDSVMDPSINKNVLVVEDNRAILEVITLILQNEAYTVTGLNKGADILYHIGLHKPHLIILDIMLPDVDGRDLLALIRSQKHIRKIPVLMISARYTDENVEHGPEKPDGFLAKPFDIDDLLKKIADILDQRS